MLGISVAHKFSCKSIVIKFPKALEKNLAMTSQTSINSDTKWRATAQQKFTSFMQEQVNRVERFRQHLCRHQRCEISLEYAVSLWIERGYAAAFRRRFEGQA